MFTGIVEEEGKIKEIYKTHSSVVIKVQGKKVLEDAALGDSIAVNGVCVTVTRIEGDTFHADLSPETMKRTNLGTLTSGSRVNLERAMQAGGRFGGHIVSGHIDGLGEITERKEEANSILFTITAPGEIMRYIAFKGSVTLDGISLTVASCSDTSFTLAIIPFTLAHTTLETKTPGAKVNVECDIISKYVERLLYFDKQDSPKQQGNLTEETLRKAGFF